MGGGANFKFEITFLRIKKGKLLRVGQENIYVVTFAMVDLQHQRCASAKRPAINDRLLRIGLADE
jgi:hypothetical protein